MIIAIDASRATRDKPTGTEFYSARLIQYLAKIGSTHTYYLYSPIAPKSELARLPANFIWKVIPFKRFWTQIRLPFALWQDKPDLLFVPAHTLPYICPVPKTVVTLHDLAYEVFPEMYDWTERRQQRSTAQLALKKATKIITPSLSTKDDLIRVYGADPNKITPIHLGFDEDRFARPTTLPDEVKQKRPYFLMVGRLEKKKNTAGVITAFGQFKTQNPGQKTKLVLIGKPGYGYEEVAVAKAALPEEVVTDIIELGYQPDTKTAAYMAGATAFLYPSLYEGFGLTLLEAMAAGIPVLSSDISSMPEVADDAAILIDPTSIDEMTKMMTILATDVLSREQVRQRGKQRVKEFSWEKTARETLAVLEEAARS